MKMLRSKASQMVAAGLFGAGLALLAYASILVRAESGLTREALLMAWVGCGMIAPGLMVLYRMALRWASEEEE